MTHYDGEANHHKHHAKQDAFLNTLCVMSTAAALIEIAESLDPCQLPSAESISINARNSAEHPAKGKILGPGPILNSIFPSFHMVCEHRSNVVLLTNQGLAYHTLPQPCK